ncbi:MAG: hypothetical protein H6Q75_1350 [Firmicutes bacterium]|nr:hypothetical protein [Bacillota bacterium]
MSHFKTEQEDFWAGQFGDAYIDRNWGNTLIAANTALFSKVLHQASQPVKSVIEFGSNIGLNLKALRGLLPEAELSAIEINAKAVDKLKASGDIKVYSQSILDFSPDYQRDLVLIKGVLIHINPDMLPVVYKLLYETSKRYICIAEYYNPTPVEVPYRGHAGRLFKRDFAGEMLDTYADLRLVDYGFVYHRDGHFPQDDLNWFLLERRQ